jgi:glycosyltransferase involved in cell wall biosynthesis
MKVSLIGCPFQSTYGEYIESLRSGLERRLGAPVQWVSSNCCCGDPFQDARGFQVNDSDYFEMREKIAGYSLVGYSHDPTKRFLRAGIRSLSNARRAKRFADLASGADVIHFQQILGAYGSDVVFRFLRQRSNAARVITVHELDDEQTDFPERNRTYNLADAVVVHDSLLKNKLASLGVAEDLVHVVRQGTDLEEGESFARDGVVFYAGHHFNEGKGIEILLSAYRSLKDRYSGPAPRLRIHGHYGPTPPTQFLEKARQLNLADDVEWLNELSSSEIVGLYRRSQVCVLPYSGGFAGLPVGVAAANRLPIIATRTAGIPDHIGDLGIWIGGDDARELADRIEKVLQDVAMSEDYGARLRAHAVEHLGWDAVARDTLDVYQSARERMTRRQKLTVAAGHPSAAETAKRA